MPAPSRQLEILASGHAVQPSGHRFRRGPAFPYATSALLLAGAVELRLADQQPVRLEAPALLTLAPRTSYALCGAGGASWEEIWVISSASVHQQELQRGWPLLLPGLRHLALDGEALAGPLRQSMESMDALRTHPLAGQLQANAWERVLLLACGIGPRTKAKERHQAVAAGLELMERTLAQRHSLRSLARRLGLSPSHLAQLYRSELGEPPMRHLRHLRIACAQRLLLGSSWRIETIARHTGFPDPCHFSGVFRREVGCSPRRFRHQGGRAGAGMSSAPPLKR